jgi:hypothetical protein
VSSKIDRIQYGRGLQVIAWANLFIAVVGLAQLLYNLVGYFFLPLKFWEQYGGSLRRPFVTMSVASGLLLTALAIGGVSLLGRSRGAIRYTNVIFVVEILYFALFWSTWSIKLSPFNFSVITAGLFNIGLVLQVVTAYPVVGLILLNTRRALS